MASAIRPFVTMAASSCLGLGSYRPNLLAALLALLVLPFHVTPRSLSTPWPMSGSIDSRQSLQIRQSAPGPIEGRVDAILSETPLIDGHDDLTFLIRFAFANGIYSANFTSQFTNGSLIGQVDLPRLKRGKVGGTFWSAFVPCPAPTTNFSQEIYSEATYQTQQQIDVFTRLREAYPAAFSVPPNSSTALGYFQAGQIISPLAIEGLHQIGTSFSILRNYYKLGVRYATLTHDCHNAFADAAVTTGSNMTRGASIPYWNGLSPRGRLVIREMNRMGMIVDLSHVSENTMLDVLGANPSEFEGSRAPVIFSHSSAYGLCPHPRNVPDRVLRLVKDTNSLVMVTFVPDYLSCEAPPAGSPNTTLPTPVPANATLARVVEHIQYIANYTGSYDHVGLGSDFDGIPTLPTGLEDVSKFPDLVAELLRRGISDADVKKIVGGNLLRVWADVDRVAADLTREGVLPVEDDDAGFPR